ncbi:MAG: hypothetical protein GX318_07805, partial [Clostridia bacterium]|nr:hypothetical protein [Clostridia bacterium]
MNRAFLSKKYSICFVVVLTFLFQVAFGAMPGFAWADGGESEITEAYDEGEDAMDEGMEAENDADPDVDLDEPEDEKDVPTGDEENDDDDAVPQKPDFQPPGMTVVPMSGGGGFDDCECDDVIQKIIATVDDVELKNIDNYRPKMGENITLRFEFELEQEHNHGEGSKLTYELPDPLCACTDEEGEIYDEDDATLKYADYKIGDGKVVVTFNSNIRHTGEDGGTMGLKVLGWFEIQAEFKSDDNKLKYTLTLPGNDPIILHFTPKGGTTIEKSAKPENDGNSSEYVEWQVLVNTEMNDLGGGETFLDTLTSDNHEYDQDSLVVTQMKIAPDGETISDSTAVVYKKDGGNNNTITPTWNAENNTLSLTLTGEFAYEIKYKTKPNDTDQESQTLKNTAKFGDGESEGTATINYGKPLNKTVQTDGEIANWTILVNGNHREMEAGTVITDTWASSDEDIKHKLVEGTFKVNDRADLPLGLKVVHNISGFELKLGENINEEFTITYSTKPTDLVTKEFTVTNTVTRDDREDKWKSMGDNCTFNQNVLKKSNSNINYQNKTVKWTIVINSAGYEMKDIFLEDEFVKKNLKILKDEDGDYEFEVKIGGETLEKDNDYTLTLIDENEEGDEKGGFELEFTNDYYDENPNINEKITITYTTKYDVENEDNVDNYKNTAKLTWTTNGTDYGEVADEDKVGINTQQRDKGYKNGWYNYEDKIFYWQVGINYNFDKIVNPVFTDTLFTDHDIDPESIIVYPLDLSGGGDGKTEVALSENTDYDLVFNESQANTFTITFKGNYSTINKAYRIVYESTKNDEYYPPDGEKYILE